MKEVIITIDENAVVKVSVRGIKGASCKDATKALEKALGDVKESKTTREYYEKGEEGHVRH